MSDIDLSRVPLAVQKSWAGTWGGDVSADDSATILAAAIDHAFNPPDDDAGCESILVNAVLDAAQFIDKQPCTCIPHPEHPDDLEWIGTPCERCTVLGRWMNKAVGR